MTTTTKAGRLARRQAREALGKALDFDLAGRYARAIHSLRQGHQQGFMCRATYRTHAASIRAQARAAGLLQATEQALAKLQTDGRVQ